MLNNDLLNDFAAAVSTLGVVLSVHIYTMHLLHWQADSLLLSYQRSTPASTPLIREHASAIPFAWNAFLLPV